MPGTKYPHFPREMEGAIVVVIEQGLLLWPGHSVSLSDSGAGSKRMSLSWLRWWKLCMGGFQGNWAADPVVCTPQLPARL